MIGIIGAGNMGTGLGRRLAAAGHRVMLSFTRTTEELAAASKAVGPDTRVGTPLETASAAEVMILATPWAVTLATVGEVAPQLRGKVVWDTTNPLKADMSGLEVGFATSAGEEIARAAPGAKIVKAIAPFAEVLHSPSTEIEGRRPGVFVCGDDREARATVLRLVADIGADGVDAGPLSNARYTEPLGMLMVQLAYGQGLGGRIGASLLSDLAAA